MLKIYSPSVQKTNFIDQYILDHQPSFMGFVDGVEEADYILLPYTWEHYYQGKEAELEALMDLSKQTGHKILGVTEGDFGYRPLDPSALLFRYGGSKSKQLEHQFERPNFYFGDPIELYFNGAFSTRPKREDISVGFCGKVNVEWKSEWSNIAELIGIQLRYLFNTKSKLPQPVFPTPGRLRKNTLDACQHERIETDYILRKKYKNGLLHLSSEELSQHQSTVDFFTNIRDTDYTLCMRGAGNFSVRFYQVMAMGRIPIMVNTDCMLPFEDKIDYRSLMPWVEYKDLHRLPEIVLDFHDRLSDQQFVALQQEIRAVWQKYLSMDGYFQELALALK